MYQVHLWQLISGVNNSQSSSTGFCQSIFNDLISNALGAMYDSFSWPDFAQFLAAIESMAPSQQAGKLLYAFWEDIGFITKRGFPHYPNNVEGFPGVAYADSDNPDNYAAWWNNAQQVELSRKESSNTLTMENRPESLLAFRSTLCLNLRAGKSAIRFHVAGLSEYLYSFMLVSVRQLIRA